MMSGCRTSPQRKPRSSPAGTPIRSATRSRRESSMGTSGSRAADGLSTSRAWLHGSRGAAADTPRSAEPASIPATFKAAASESATATAVAPNMPTVRLDAVRGEPSGNATPDNPGLRFGIPDGIRTESVGSDGRE